MSGVSLQGPTDDPLHGFRHGRPPRAALPQDPAKIPPNLRYFLDLVQLLKDMKPGDLTSKSILLGPPATIIEDLKTLEASGISEVVLYFNFGNKPHQMVKEQMARFMAEVAPAFDGAHKRIAAAG